MRTACHVLFGIILLLGQTYAQTGNRDVQKEDAIWQQLSHIAPQLVDTFREATTQMDAGQYLDAAALYQKVVDAAPNFDVGYRRLGICLGSAGEIDKAMPLLEKAVELNRSAPNLSTWASFLALPAKGIRPSQQDLERAFSLLSEAAQLDKQSDPEDMLLLAQVAWSTLKEKEFRLATSRLMEKFPSLAGSHYFNAIRFALDEQWAAAEDEIMVAQKMGLDSTVVQRFLDSGVHSRALAWRYVGYTVRVVAAWIAGLLLLVVGGKLLSELTLSSIKRNAASTDEVGSRELALRHLYRYLINIAAFYYYVSLPFVIVVLLAVVGSIFYAFLLAGQIPIRLMLFLGLGTIITISKMIHSLFIKVKSQEPGRVLRPSEAPGLWKISQSVAEDVGTRPIEEIRITPGTELAVYETGTRKERALDKGRRILILGIGTLNGFRTNAFKAVLAHEYGHFAHRDTAGGDAALRVGNDMMKFAWAMAYAGQAVWWNLGFQFVRLYDYTFRRISFGASRLQEVLADRTSALRYGSAAFEEGLRHVVRRTLELNRVAHREMGFARTTGKHLQNLYEISAEQDASIDEELEKTLNRKTSEDDTHPSPAERFRLVRQINAPVAVSEQASFVWDFFLNRTTITGEMTSWIDQAIPRSAAVPADAVPKFTEIDL